MMRKIGYMSLLVFFALSTGLYAKPDRAGEKQLTQKVLKRTAAVIHMAHKAVKENKNFTGDLAKAVKHQRFAKMLFRNGDFKRAAHHSLRARQFAFAALKANKGKAEEEKFTDEAAIAPAPGSSQLDDEVAKEMPSVSMKDEDVIASNVEID